MTDFNHIKAQLTGSNYTVNLIKHSIKNKLPEGRHHYILIYSFFPIQQQVAFHCFFPQEIWDLKQQTNNKYYKSEAHLSLYQSHLILNEEYTVKLHFLDKI